MILPTEGSDLVLRARGLNKVYQSGSSTIPALIDADVDIFSGEFVAMLGPSGSGKSTLLNLLSTLDEPTSGDLQIEGEPIAGRSDASISQLRNRKMGFVFQAYNLLTTLTAVANVALPCIYRELDARESQTRALAALEQVGIENLANRKPSQLSGGQQQRVAFARALVLEPKILFADEPTGALDSEATRNIVELCNELAAKGLAVIAVTHDPEVAKYASRVIEMFDGRIVSDLRKTPS